MFRTLTLLTLAAGVVTTVSAQGTEIIIRRSGQKDQVIRLDDKQALEMTARVSDQLKGALKDLKEIELNHQGDVVRLKIDTTMMRNQARMLEGHVKELASRSTELAARTATLSRIKPELMARTIREAMAQPRIGIFVDNSSSQESDKYGALVSSVSPGGPADKAGIRSGDIITKIDGKSLASTGAKDEALPGVRLIEIVSKLQVGKAVPVEYRRGTTTNTTKVAPVEEDEIAFTSTMPLTLYRADSAMAGRLAFPRNAIGTRMSVPAMPERNNITVFEDAIPGAPGGSFSYAFTNGGPLSNLELVSLNEKLGSYFGTSDGVLVVNVGPKDAFGLMPGDVIVSVDGRKVSASSQLMRILRTYQKGEEFKIQIMRQKKAETLTGKLP
jgi:S1-C subfamily serine protease